MKSVNGENKDFYQLVPQEGAAKGVVSTDAEEAASGPPAPPVVVSGRFTGFCFGEDLQEEEGDSTNAYTIDYMNFQSLLHREVTDPQQLVEDAFETLIQSASYLSRAKRKGRN